MGTRGKLTPFCIRPLSENFLVPLYAGGRSEAEAPTANTEVLLSHFQSFALIVFLWSIELMNRDVLQHCGTRILGESLFNLEL